MMNCTSAELWMLCCNLSDNHKETLLGFGKKKIAIFSLFTLLPNQSGLSTSSMKESQTERSEDAIMRRCCRDPHQGETFNRFLWCRDDSFPLVREAVDHPKVMDLTKDERSDWSNRSEMIEIDQSWQTDASHTTLPGYLDRGVWRTGWWRRITPHPSLWRQKPGLQLFMQQHIHWLDCVHVRMDRQNTLSHGKHKLTEGNHQSVHIHSKHWLCNYRP